MGLGEGSGESAPERACGQKRMRCPSRITRADRSTSSQCLDARDAAGSAAWCRHQSAETRAPCGTLVGGAAQGRAALSKRRALGSGGWAGQPL